MDLSGLTRIGKLGGCDDRGFFQILVKPRYLDQLLSSEDVFLIFNSHRVFCVTICDRELSDRRTLVRFAEDGIREERKLHREVAIAIPSALEDADDPDELLGFIAVFEDRQLGRIRDYFHNNAQYVLVIETAGGRELLVPWVDHYVSEVLPGPGVVVLTNVQPLLDLEADSEAPEAER
jgi:ribosomal 30S subunit maturation factor RimM